MALWPLPRHLKSGSTTLWLDPDVQYAHHVNSQPLRDEVPWYQGLEKPQSSHHLPATKPPSYPQDVLEVAFQRFNSKVFSEHFVPHKFYPRRSRFEPSIDGTGMLINKITINEVSFVSLGNGQHTVSREAYLIRILQDGTTTLEILSPEGGIHAFDTFAQLFYAHSAIGESVYTPYAPVLITDAPAFEHRGLNLDISRNWIAPQDVLRTIEAMGFNKFNKLHLHATDAQSWPLEIPASPDLSSKGAYRWDQVWTTKDLENVQRHGLYHGVEVYLEIDLPGHSASIFHSYPGLITAYDKPWNKYAQEPPSGQLKLDSPSVPPFLTILFNDLLPRTQPFSTHFHIGGDEINKESYVLEPTVKSSSKVDIQPLLQKFMNHVLSLLENHSLTPIVWEDMLLEWNLELPPDTIIQTWRSASSLAKVVEKGGPIARSSARAKNGIWTADSAPLLIPKIQGIRNRLLNILIVIADIPEEKKYLVVGGEVHLWCELTDGVNLDSMLWPRAAAAAEVLWRGKGEVGEGTTRRLAEMRERLVARGIGAGMVQMTWGLMNEGSCIL
ncbi:hypothetical protein JMJ35_000320 [Cladonia borealis]|uniref:Beta-hexosaminidase n=1 Tax=Cladonia borealis TaxID=184061 RepID=A0AA39R963_9LECA|nr:hypothetical protein JMJ35_000320 [Cladonia borealis]